jgi:hypothetical protein
MNIEDMYLQEDLLTSGIKESSISVKETIEENIVINQGMNLEGLHHKEDNFLLGIEVYFPVIVLIVITLDIKL